MLVIVAKWEAPNWDLLSFSGPTGHSASNSEKKFGIGIIVFREISFFPEKHILSGFGANSRLRYSVKIGSSNFGFVVIFWSDWSFRIK